MPSERPDESQKSDSRRISVVEALLRQGLYPARREISVQGLSSLKQKLLSGSLILSGMEFCARSARKPCELDDSLHSLYLLSQVTVAQRSTESGYSYLSKSSKRTVSSKKILIGIDLAAGPDQTAIQYR